MLKGLKVPSENTVHTTYKDKYDIIPMLSQREISLLSTESFVTPFDDFSRDSNAQHDTDSKHSIIYGNNQNIRLYVNRTTVSDDADNETKLAFQTLLSIIDEAPIAKTVIDQNSLFIFPNLGGLHSRELGDIQNKELLYDRWILKTYNFSSTESMMRHQDTFVPGVDGLVDDHKINLN